MGFQTEQYSSANCALHRYHTAVIWSVCLFSLIRRSSDEWEVEVRWKRRALIGVMGRRRVMRCRRCSGLMVRDAYSDSMIQKGEAERPTFRCVNCGALVYWSIRKNSVSRGRRLLRPERTPVRELRRRYPIQASMAGQGTMEKE